MKILTANLILFSTLIGGFFSPIMSPVQLLAQSSAIHSLDISAPLSLQLDSSGHATDLITTAQYCAFLNAVAQYDDSYNLYTPPKIIGGLTDARENVITRNTMTPPYTYSVVSGKKIIGYDIFGQPIFSTLDIADYPITNITLFSAARFCNWICNGQPTGSEGPATTEKGAYTIHEVSAQLSNDNYITLVSGSSWRLPHQNEFTPAELALERDPNINIVEWTDTQNIHYNSELWAPRYYYLSGTPPGAQLGTFYASQQGCYVGFRLIKQ